LRVLIVFEQKRRRAIIATTGGRVGKKSVKSAVVAFF